MVTLIAHHRFVVYKGITPTPILLLSPEFTVVVDRLIDLALIFELQSRIYIYISGLAFALLVRTVRALCNSRASHLGVEAVRVVDAAAVALAAGVQSVAVLPMG